MTSNAPDRPTCKRRLANKHPQLGAIALAVLAVGPVFGAYSMWRLHALPQARLMASGNR